MFGSMVCWGSWANTVKLTPGWRFQSFYWDYVIGVLLGSFLWGLVLGGGPQFLHGMRTASGSAILLAVLAGIVFNAANQLLVAAIDLFDGLLILVPTKRVGPLCLDRLYRTHDRFRAQFLDDGRRGAPGQSSSLLQESRPHRWPCAWIGGPCSLDHRFSKS